MRTSLTSFRVEMSLWISFQAKAMALTIADAFKLAYEYYEKGKSTTNRESPRVAQDDNKENSQQTLPLVNNRSADMYATPVKARPRSDTPTIEVTSDSFASAVEDSGRKMQALVMLCFKLYTQLTLLR